METIIIEVYVPSVQKSFDIRLPVALHTGIASYLAARALSDMSDGAYLPSKSSFLAWKSSGAPLNMDKSLQEQNVINGSQLLLI